MSLKYWYHFVSISVSIISKNVNGIQPYLQANQILHDNGYHLLLYVVFRDGLIILHWTDLGMLCSETVLSSYTGLISVCCVQRWPYHPTLDWSQYVVFRDGQAYHLTSNSSQPFLLSLAIISEPMDYCNMHTKQNVIPLGLKWRKMMKIMCQKTVNNAILWYLEYVSMTSSYNQQQCHLVVPKRDCSKT